MQIHRDRVGRHRRSWCPSQGKLRDLQVSAPIYGALARGSDHDALRESCLVHV